MSLVSLVSLALRVPRAASTRAKVSDVTGPTVTFAPNEIAHADATCPAGTAVIGGGYYASIAHVAADKTYGDGRTWSVLIHNDSSISIQVNAHAVCAAR